MQLPAQLLKHFTSLKTKAKENKIRPILQKEP